MDIHTLIVGAGVFGTSTAYHLARSDPQRAAGIVLLDRTPAPPVPAASTDINKIVRADYSNPLYCELAYEAIDAWSSWPELKPYYHKTGWVMIDEADSDLAQRIRSVFRERGHDPTADVPLAELSSERRWGGALKHTQTDGFKDAYWNPEAGWCEAADATAAMAKAAIDMGVRYVCGEVEQLVLEHGKVTGLRTKDGSIHTAGKIVLATGAWTSAVLLPTELELNIPEEDRVEKQATAAGVAVAHYKLTDDEFQALEQMPVVVYGGNGEVIPPPKSNRLLKYTNAHPFTNPTKTPSGVTISFPPDRDQHIVPESLRRETQQNMMSRVMSNFSNREPEYWRLCWDARTPSQDWLLSRHPDPRLENLFLAIGGSFHSYKFLPNVGKYMTNVLLGKSNGERRDRAWTWKSSRFAGRGAHEKSEPKRTLADLEGSV